MNRDLDEFVRCELKTISSQLQSDLASTSDFPKQLYYLTDATGIGPVVRDGVLRALHSRLGWGDSIASYGIGLVHEFLTDRLHSASDSLSEEFCKATLANFSPLNAHNNCFVARLFEDDGSNTWSGGTFPGYALGFQTADMPIKTAANEHGAKIRLRQAIYSREVQLGIVRTLYMSYEAYYADAVRRFGDENQWVVLPACWSMFLQDLDVGEFLLRFRSPAFSHENEWIAIALASEEVNEEVKFDIIDNRFAPCISLDITTQSKDSKRKLPLATIVIGVSLPFETTKESLQIFIRRYLPPNISRSYVAYRQADMHAA